MEARVWERGWVALALKVGQQDRRGLKGMGFQSWWLILGGSVEG